MNYYLIDGHEPFKVSQEEWTRYHTIIHVSLTTFDFNKLVVSTVFLGIDYGWNEKPILFETMVFGLDYEICERYSTWDEAAKGHREIVARYFRWESDLGAEVICPQIVSKI